MSEKMETANENVRVLPVFGGWFEIYRGDLMPKGRPLFLGT